MLDKYLELSRIAQDLERENLELRDALIKLDGQYYNLEQTLKEKDKFIADLIIEKTRLKDLLTLGAVDFEKVQKENRMLAEGLK